MNTKTVSSDEAAAMLARGAVIAYPTETVWGIGCDATNSEAVRRVFAIKRRAEAKALITLVSDIAMLERWVDGIPEVAYELLEAAVDPLTSPAIVEAVDAIVDPADAPPAAGKPSTVIKLGAGGVFKILRK